MIRAEALELVRSKTSAKNLIKHMLATEAVMIGLAKHFNEDEEKWALAGLVHDIDYDDTINDPNNHAIVAARLLEAKGVPADVVHAVMGHADKVQRVTKMDKALYCADPLTGFLVACALLVKDPQPGKLSSVDVSFAMRRFKEKSFARGADRNQMLACGELGLSLEEFIGIGLASMQAISPELGL